MKRKREKLFGQYAEMRLIADKNQQYLFYFYKIKNTHTEKNIREIPKSHQINLTGYEKRKCVCACAFGFATRMRKTVNSRKLLFGVLISERTNVPN